MALYLRTDLKKARELCQRLKTDADGLKLAPVHQKELTLILANLTVLEREFSSGKEELRNCLKMNFDPKRTAQILNNLAYATWKENQLIESQKGKEGMENLQAQAEQDKKYVLSWLKEAL